MHLAAKGSHPTAEKHWPRVRFWDLMLACVAWSCELLTSFLPVFLPLSQNIKDVSHAPGTLLTLLPKNNPEMIFCLHREFARLTFSPTTLVLYCDLRKGFLAPSAWVWLCSPIIVCDKHLITIEPWAEVRRFELPSPGLRNLLVSMPSSGILALSAFLLYSMGWRHSMNFLWMQMCWQKWASNSLDKYNTPALDPGTSPFSLVKYSRLLVLNL